MWINPRTVIWSVGLSAVLLATIVVSVGIGPVRIDPVVILKIFVNHVSVPLPAETGTGNPHGSVSTLPFGIEFVPLFEYDVPDAHSTIVMQIRLPRVLLGALVGIALAIAGTVMQGFFRNPMADPSIIGVSSGAAVGAVAAITLPFALPFGLELQTAAFVGGVVTAFGVYLIATEGGRTPVATLLLAGIAVQTFLGAVISFMLLRSGRAMDEAVYWLMGHLHYASWSRVHGLAITLPILVIMLFAYGRDLNVLLLGEEEAHNLGVEVERTKRILLLVSSVVTAMAVAVSGVIGFVGLIVPHMMRLLVGPDHRILLPTSALAGGAFLVAADTVARSGPGEIPVGIVTAALGAPFFLYLLRRRKVYAL